MIAANPNFKAQWQDWSARFAALQGREKRLIVGAVLFATIFGGHSFWIEPAQLQSARLKKTLAQQQTEQEQLSAQLIVVASQKKDPDAAIRTQLQQLRIRLDETEHNLKALDGTLVPPARMPQLLQTLLTRHRGLTLLSLHTLPPQPLIPLPEKQGEKGGGKESGKDGSKGGSGGGEGGMPSGNLYKHGIEIKLSGPYHDLLAYLNELEGNRQKLLWGGMRFAVGSHPIGELTLTVYTLSLDSTWLVV